METKAFSISAVLTITTGRLLCPEGMGPMCEVLNWMTGEDVFTHQIPRIVDEARPAILRLHPDLAAVDGEAEGTNPDNLEARLQVWVDRYGPEIAVPRLTEDEHERIDPLSELVEKVHPSRIVVVRTEGGRDG